MHASNFVLNVMGLLLGVGNAGGKRHILHLKSIVRNDVIVIVI